MLLRAGASAGEQGAAGRVLAEAAVDWSASGRVEDHPGPPGGERTVASKDIPPNGNRGRLMLAKLN